jgi:uncharacterized protein (DUF305 family)
MKRTPPPPLAALLALMTCAACGGPGAPAGGVPASPGPPTATPAEPANPAAVEFMSGMIHHHAQALLMAGWADSHGASPRILTLSERITVSQRDEIDLMQWWLRDNGEPAPEPNPRGMTMTMGGVEHEMLMPGMLTEAQLAELDRARGTDFDRLFLRFMIQHHEGALQMVDTLFSSYGGTQDDDIYKFASDVFADQTAEIDRMQGMLEAMSPGGGALR